MITIMPVVELVENIPARMVVVIITMKVAGAAVDAALNLVNLLIQKPKPSLKTKARNIYIYLNYGVQFLCN
jgi:hypothetical protein